MVSKKIAELSLQQVNHNSPVPLYHQIEVDLQRLMTAGELLPQDVLPPEIELSRAYGVGRHTMRMALSRLTSAGWIARQAGRGTFVRERPPRPAFYLDDSFTRQMANMGMVAHSRVLDSAVSVIDARSPAALQEHPGAPCFYLARLRYGDAMPIVLQYAHIITERCPHLEQFDFGQRSLYEVLSTEYALVVQRLTHTVSAVAADRVHMEHLRVRRGTPLLLVKTSVFLDSGDIIEHTTSYYRADRYEYSVTRTGA
ncbi:MAG: GntR family transcriptional regulator [Anaerolineae bacterium]|jgi:GntR family transcriptional regulator|nr:GntR family transcriptional regulator [Anaerolineae bacterium]